ncbi:MAG: hypothetical protein KatS3mg115_0735 [Candidatus Poribacteria bacterium]|nr:MAG: hypothetical protein KatS3mg115_0735 [Candidatus Poribacteria bacterium]
MNHQNDPIDLYSVYRELKRSGNLEKAGGLTALHELQDSVPTSAHAEYYARIVKEMAIRRELIDAGARDHRSGERRGAEP